MAKKQYKIQDNLEIYAPGRGGSPADVLDHENGNRQGLGIDWYRDFSNLEGGDRFKQVLTIPEVKDFPTILARAIFKSERQRNAVIRLWHRHQKFGDVGHQEMLRCFLAGTIAMNGRGRVDGVFSTVGMLAPDMYRTVAGLPRHKNGDQERVIRSSDFRKEDKSESSLANQR